MGTFLGVDVGTSAVKAILVDRDERVLAEAEVPLATSRPRPGWSEQAPEDWWAAVVGALGRLRALAPAGYAGCRGLGLSGQMHGAVLLDAGHRVLRPAILWNDGRSVAECEVLNRDVPDLAAVAGVHAMPGLTAPKLLWVRRNEPETFARTALVLPPKDYVRLRLTGDAATDPCDAAGTLWLDEAARRWHGPAVAACGLDPAQLPRVVEGTEASGTLLPAVASDLGLKPGVVVAGGAGDAAAGCVGIGAVNEGDAFVSLGTSCQYFVTGDAYRPYARDAIHGFAHGVPGRWFQMAAMLNGASCLSWVAGVLGEADIGALLDRVAATDRRDGRLLFLPYLSGERTPHDDADARGVFFGLGPETTREDLARAVLEGVALTLVEAQEALGRAGARPASLAAIGGGARSPYWMGMLASALGRPVRLYEGGSRGPAFGAARLARIAVTGEAVGDVCRPPPVERVMEPDAGETARLAERAVLFRGVYRALRPHFPALAQGGLPWKPWRYSTTARRT